MSGSLVFEPLPLYKSIPRGSPLPLPYFSPKADVPAAELPCTIFTSTMMGCLRRLFDDRVDLFPANWFNKSCIRGRTAFSIILRSSMSSWRNGIYNSPWKLASALYIGLKNSPFFSRWEDVTHLNRSQFNSRLWERSIKGITFDIFAKCTDRRYHIFTAVTKEALPNQQSRLVLQASSPDHLYRCLLHAVWCHWAKFGGPFAILKVSFKWPVFPSVQIDVI